MTARCRTLITDKQRIVAAWTVPEIENGDGYRVGCDGVSAIRVYQEPGQAAMVPWIAVYRNGRVWIRRPASATAVEYALEDD